MNLCIISCPAILLAFLVVQNYYNEVEAKSHLSSAEQWYNSLQKKSESVLNESDILPDAPLRIPLEKLEKSKKKKRIKKHKKKKTKRKHEQVVHKQHDVPRDQIFNVHVKPANGKDDRRPMSKKDKKKNKEKLNRRKFVKLMQKDFGFAASNSSGSDETTRRKPVDIIVHIKMNE